MSDFYQQQAAKSRQIRRVPREVKPVAATDLDYQERRVVISLLRIYRRKFPEEYDKIGREPLLTVVE